MCIYRKVCRGIDPLLAEGVRYPISRPLLSTASRGRNDAGPPDRWYVYRAPLLSVEVWPIARVWSTLLTLQQKARCRRDIATAIEEFEQLRERLAGARIRLRGAAGIDPQVKILHQHPAHP